MTDKSTNGKTIAENIRKLLFSCQMRVIYAAGQIKIANEDYKLFSKSKQKKNLKKAILAKAKREAYKTYLKNIENIQQEINVALDVVLSRYSPKHKKIFELFFLSEKNIQEISTEVHYSERQVKNIIFKLKNDLVDNFKH